MMVMPSGSSALPIIVCPRRTMRRRRRRGDDKLNHGRLPTGSATPRILPQALPSVLHHPTPANCSMLLHLAPSGQILKIGSERPLDEVSEREPALLSNQPGDVLLWPSTNSATLQFPRPSREPPSRRVGFENVVPHSIDLSRISVQHTHTHTHTIMVAIPAVHAIPQDMSQVWPSSAAEWFVQGPRRQD